MQRYTLIPVVRNKEITSKSFDLDTIEQIAKHFGCTTGSVHHYFERNNSTLTLAEHRIIDNNSSINAAKRQAEDDALRAEALEIARAELAAEAAESESEEEKPKRKYTKRSDVEPTAGE